MKVIFRSNDYVAKELLGLEGGAEEFVQPLEKYLSDKALIRMSLIIGKNDNALASLDIVDKNLHIFAKDVNCNKVTAIQSVIKKIESQLEKKKGKKEVSRDTFIYNDVDLNSEVFNAIESVEIEEELIAKSKTPRFQRSMDRYEQASNVRYEIDRNAEHLEQLYNIEKTEANTILHKDYLLLEKSIDELCDEFCYLLDKEAEVYPTRRQKKYIESYCEDINKLSLKKK